MASETTVLLLNNNELTYTGSTATVDPFSSNRNNLFTVSFSVSNFAGRIYIQGSLSVNPQPEDWFDIKLTDQADYLDFVQETDTIGKTFSSTIVAIRAKVDRDHLGDPAYDYATHGTLDKISVNY